MAGISEVLRERLAATVDSIADQVFAEGGGLQPGHPVSAGDYRAVAAKMISTALLSRLSDCSQRPTSPVVLREAAAHFARLGIPLQLLLDRIDLTQTIALRTWWPLVDEDDVLDMLSFSSLVADTVAEIKRDMTRGYHMSCADHGAPLSARFEVADRLLAGEPPARGDVARTGVWIADRYVVLGTSWPVGEGGSAGHDTLSAVCADHDVLWARRSETLFFLVPGGLRPQVEHGITGAVARLAGENRVFGCSTVHDTSRVPVAAAQATDALLIALSCGMEGTVKHEALALERALWHDPAAREDLVRVLRDLESHRHLVETLDTFYRCDMDKTKTAAALGLARRSLASRLRRIGELTGHQPTRGRGAAVLSAAVMARRMARSRA